MCNNIFVKYINKKQGIKYFCLSVGTGKGPLFLLQTVCLPLSFLFALSLFDSPCFVVNGLLYHYLTNIGSSTSRTWYVIVIHLSYSYMMKNFLRTTCQQFCDVIDCLSKERALARKDASEYITVSNRFNTDSCSIVNNTESELKHLIDIVSIRYCFNAFQIYTARSGDTPF